MCISHTIYKDKIDTALNINPIIVVVNKNGIENIDAKNVIVDNKMNWTLMGWTKVLGEDGVYYKTVNAGEGMSDCHIINGEDTDKKDKITVSDTITQSDLKNYTSTLIFTAYAIQQHGFDTVADAWAQANTASE